MIVKIYCVKQTIVAQSATIVGNGVDAGRHLLPYT